jgi:ribonuclease HII
MLNGMTKKNLAHPDLVYEEALWALDKERVAGVDEVGRGCLSGPVVACAVVLPLRCPPIAQVCDSKLLDPALRAHLSAQICAQALAVGIGAAGVAEIERVNILRASHLAMARALRRVGPVDHALVDGSLVRGVDLGEHTTIVDGDALCYSIACASIVAKVVRDRFMERLARRHPGYGWERNAGYGTPQHLAALATLGITVWHRRTFAPVRRLIENC